MLYWKHSRVRVTSCRARRRTRHNSHVIQVATPVLSMPNFEFLKSDHYKPRYAQFCEMKSIPICSLSPQQVFLTIITCLVIFSCWKKILLKFEKCLYVCLCANSVYGPMGYSITGSWGFPLGRSLTTWTNTPKHGYTLRKIIGLTLVSLMSWLSIKSV